MNRPEFRELAEFEFTDVVGNRAVKGNSDLKRALIQNVDARWEMFTGGRSVVAASAFYKHFDQPIERVVIAAANPIATFQNADTARNFGIELEAGHQFGTHFFFNANYTFVDSKITLSPEQLGVQTSSERPLAGQSRNLFNVAGEFFVGGFSTRLLFNYFGDRIADVGANEAPDIIEQGRGRLDLVFSQRVRGLNIRLQRREPDRQRVPLHADADDSGNAAIVQAGPNRVDFVRLQRVLRPVMTNSRSTNGIMHLSRIAIALAAAAALAVVHSAGMSADQAPPVNVPGIDKPVIVVTGDVSANETWTSANYYVLRGAVFVRSGSTLNIQAGTRVIGESGSVGTLIVERGGRLNAIGTATAPIVFTSDQPIGQRGRGDWGGIIINGRAPINFGSGEAAGEGDTGVYGGTDPNDNSGILRYVRVEFAGIEFSPDNELNGIAFQAVGRGTQVDHVQSHLSRDDALEWFGGTVDGKYLVMSGAADDSLDWTFGWSGRIQFAAILQRGDDADNAIEADNNEFNNNVHTAVESADLQRHDLRGSRWDRVGGAACAPTCAAARRSRSATS